MTQKKTKKKTAPVKDERPGQPIAPAPGRLFAGVVFFCVIGLFAAARLPFDWLAIIGCIAVLTTGGLILERAGRSRAKREPHPLYVPGRLPSDSPKLKIVAIAVTFVLLLLVLSVSVQPNIRTSPFPFFLAAGYLYLVLPQALARRALRRYEQKTTKESDADK